jgi:hypothetical protein
VIWDREVHAEAVKLPTVRSVTVFRIDVVQMSQTALVFLSVLQTQLALMLLVQMEVGVVHQIL